MVVYRPMSPEETPEVLCVWLRLLCLSASEDILEPTIVMHMDVPQLFKKLLACKQTASQR